ncbi:TetR/AcrR family transcriptional regulator C-terminal domain-containing protein [Nocardia brevicatena]|uniref:TetR/AcrR family transcriptional regulator C-terminal domain-containing protein n=1 Tax=Nocardia brevicatena TaxID=37327 RepID=UPI000307FB81|nr:TetR/AcrR family transcriptional regulator C-terminal domain-containing protein [Nocardia brevicatena]
MRCHRWVSALLGTRPLLGPNALERSEGTYAALVRAGLTGPLLIAAVSAVTDYTHGFVSAENAWRSRVRDPDDEAELRREAQQCLAERHPILHRHAQLDYADFDAGFDLGPEIVLDGIRVQVDRKESTASTEPAAGPSDGRPG